jgi:hypothetical protein
MTSGSAARTRLRRGVRCRLASSNVQAGLSLLCLALLAAIGYGLANGRAVFAGNWPAWVLPALVLVVPWAAGLTAWARADEGGIRWRYWARHSVPWQQVTRVTLTERSLSFTPVGATSTPAVVVHARTSPKPRSGSGIEYAIRPGQGAGRHLREFANEITAAARAHGVRVVVESSGWDEPMPVDVQEKTWP